MPITTIHYDPEQLTEVLALARPDKHRMVVGSFKEDGDTYSCIEATMPDLSDISEQSADFKKYGKDKAGLQAFGREHYAFMSRLIALTKTKELALPLEQLDGSLKGVEPSQRKKYRSAAFKAWDQAYRDHKNETLENVTILPGNVGLKNSELQELCGKYKQFIVQQEPQSTDSKDVTFVSEDQFTQKSVDEVEEFSDPLRSHALLNASVNTKQSRENRAAVLYWFIDEGSDEAYMLMQRGLKNRRKKQHTWDLPIAHLNEETVPEAAARALSSTIDDDVKPNAFQFFADPIITGNEQTYCLQYHGQKTFSEMKTLVSQKAGFIELTLVKFSDLATQDEIDGDPVAPASLQTVRHLHALLMEHELLMEHARGVEQFEEPIGDNVVPFLDSSDNSSSSSSDEAEGAAAGANADLGATTSGATDSSNTNTDPGAIPSTATTIPDATDDLPTTRPSNAASSVTIYYDPTHLTEEQARGLSVDHYQERARLATSGKPENLALPSKGKHRMIVGPITILRDLKGKKRNVDVACISATAPNLSVTTLYSDEINQPASPEDVKKYGADINAFKQAHRVLMTRVLALTETEELVVPIELFGELNVLTQEKQTEYKKAAIDAWYDAFEDHATSRQDDVPKRLKIIVPKDKKNLKTSISNLIEKRKLGKEIQILRKDILAYVASKTKKSSEKTLVNPNSDQTVGGNYRGISSRDLPLGEKIACCIVSIVPEGFFAYHTNLVARHSVGHNSEIQLQAFDKALRSPEEETTRNHDAKDSNHVATDTNSRPTFEPKKTGTHNKVQQRPKPQPKRERKTEQQPEHPPAQQNLQYRIIQTTGENHNCLGASMGEWLVVQALHGSVETKNHLQSSNHRFESLFNALKAQPANADQIHDVPSNVSLVDGDKVASFAALAELPTEERQVRLGAAMRSELANIFMTNGGENASNAVKQRLSHFEDTLLNAFDHFLNWTVSAESPSFEFPAEFKDLIGKPLNLLQKFQELKALNVENNDLKKTTLQTWWRESGRGLYGHTIAKPGSYLMEQHGALLAVRFGLHFQYKSVHEDAIGEVINGIEDENAPTLIVYNASGHWSAYLPQSTINSFNQSKSAVDQMLQVAQGVETADAAARRAREADEAQRKRAEEAALRTAADEEARASVVIDTPNYVDNLEHVKKIVDEEDDNNISSSTLNTDIGTEGFFSRIQTYFADKKYSDDEQWKTYFSELPYDPKTKVLTTQKGIELQFSTVIKPKSKKPDPKAPKGLPPEEVTELVITARYKKPADENLAFSKADARKEKLKSIALGFRISFMANGMTKDRLQIDLRKIGNAWKRTETIKAFKEAGFKRILIQGEEVWQSDDFETEAEDNSITARVPEKVPHLLSTRQLGEFAGVGAFFAGAGTLAYRSGLLDKVATGGWSRAFAMSFANLLPLVNSLPRLMPSAFEYIPFQVTRRTARVATDLPGILLAFYCASRSMPLLAVKIIEYGVRRMPAKETGSLLLSGLQYIPGSQQVVQRLNPLVGSAQRFWQRVVPSQVQALMPYAALGGAAYYQYALGLGLGVTNLPAITAMLIAYSVFNRTNDVEGDKSFAMLAAAGALVGVNVATLGLSSVLSAGAGYLPGVFASLTGSASWLFSSGPDTPSKMPLLLGDGSTTNETSVLYSAAENPHHLFSSSPTIETPNTPARSTFRVEYQ